MLLRATEKDEVVLIEILANSGNPANADNPIAVSEYKNVEFPDVSGKVAIISGMPMGAALRVGCYYKNLFQVLAIANPRNKVAEVFHSLSQEYPVGSTIPLV